MSDNKETPVSENGKVAVTKEFKVSSWGYRHQQSFVLFITMSVAYSMRACMGVALVAMTLESNDNVTSAVNGTNITTTDEPRGFLNVLMLVPPYIRFNWSKKVQELILSSFYAGYMTLQIPGGHFAHRIGCRRMLIGAMTINCIISLLIPPISYYGGWVCTGISRIVQGLSQGVLVPGMHTCLGKWAPLEERSRLSAFTYGGQAFATVLGISLTGFISSSPLGWPGIFRVFGFLSGLNALLLYWYAFDSPALHPKISDDERNYIEQSIGGQQKKKNAAVPWSKILRHRGLYANIMGHIGSTWGQVVLFSEVPAFMNNIMGVNIKMNGLLTALPFLVMWFMNFFFSWLADFLIVNKILSVTNTRKLGQTLGSVPPAIGLVTLAYAPKNIYVVESILITICAFKIACHVGFQVNHIDISPNYAGTMMSVSNFSSNMMGTFAPIVTGFILTDVHSEVLWRRVFFVTAGSYLCTNVFYVIFATCERAEWDDFEEEKVEDELEYVPMMKEEKEKEAKVKVEG